MKKILALLLVLVMVFGLVACGETAAPAEETKPAETTEQAPEAEAKTVKVGFIFLHDEQSTYDLNFMNAAKEACEELGIEYIQKVGIPEGQECYEAAMDLVDEGCNIVFADSFGHEDYMIQAAKSARTWSSAMPPAPRRTPRDLTIIITRSLPSTKAATSPASPRA